MKAYTVEQVAAILQIGRDKVYTLIRTGRLHSIKIDKLRRITDEQLAQMCRARAAEVKDPLMQEALLLFPEGFCLDSEGSG